MFKIIFSFFIFASSLFANESVFSTEFILNNIENVEKFLVVAAMILFVYILLFIFAQIIFKYFSKNIEDDELSHRYFAINKIKNIIFILITILILILAFTEDIVGGLTIFGVIGAGLTIVMKEVILNLVAWGMIMTSSSIRLGDRIKIERGSKPVIGDVIDISLSKITLYENITNDAIAEHKKAGRIIFIPNHFIIFNDVYNYTHLAMKTILDAIEINLSYESNFDKAEKIALEIIEDLSGRYADMGKRQYDKLKERYTMRNMPSYPRVFFYPSLKGNGVTIGVWYITPYREILRIKSDLTKRIVQRFKEEDDIKLIYTGNSMFITSGATPKDGKDLNFSSLF